MSPTHHCPACGNPLPTDAPAGLCPRCLLAGAFATAASPSAPNFEPPTVDELAPLFPQLEIIELLGAGGMGAVYKACQPHLERLVALKVLPPRDDPAFAQRFVREARALAKLNHPGIVHVYDFGQAGGHSYIVMEFVGGVNLRQAVRAGRMRPAEALAVVPQICAALQFAHEAGIVHRDIKPENILLDPTGRVKIADFGLAKLLGSAGPQHLTGTHQAMGTLHYMAPEQWEKPATVDHRADIYSLGVVFYELLTGELPLGRFAPPSEKVQIDVRLDQVVLRALEKEPERRYQQASDVKTDVERITSRPTAAAGPENEAPRRWTTSRVMAVCVLIASVFVWPFGMIALPAVWWIARKQRRSMVSVVDEAVRFLGLHRAATWALIVCLAGATSAAWPWAIVKNGNRQRFLSAFELARGSTWCALGISGGFLFLALFFFITAQLPRLRLWRAGVALAGGATLALFAGHDFALYVGPGPFVAAALAIALMGLGAIEARGHLANRPPPPTVLPEDSGTAPVRPSEPPPIPAPPVASGRPRFLFHVGLPVLALVVLGLVGYWLDNPVSSPAAKAPGPLLLGLLIAVALSVRWLWLSRRSHSPLTGGRTGPGGPDPEAVVPPGPQRSNEPRTRPPRATGPARPSFLLHVGLPALAFIVLAFAARVTANGDTDPSSQALARRLLDVVGFAGPLIVVAMFIRWAWLTLRPRMPAGFWILAGILALTTAVAYWRVDLRVTSILGWAGDTPSVPPAEQIVGTWWEADQERFFILFGADGGVNRVFRRRLQDLRPGERPDPDPDHAPWIDQKGDYRWVEGETIEVQIPGVPLVRYRLSPERDHLTLTDENGVAKRLNRWKRPTIPAGDPP